MIAAPFITPADPHTRLSRQVVWLPAGPKGSVGQWFGFFDGLPYAGDSWHAIYGRLADIPVFAKAGAIVPLAAAGENGVDNPAVLDIHLFPGADNDFALYEDDGLHAHSLTPLTQQFSETEWTVTVGPAKGETGHLPDRRTWTLLFRGAAAETAVSANQPITTQYNAQTHTLTVTAQPLAPTATLTATLTPGENGLLAPRQPRLETCRRLVTTFRMESWQKQRLFGQLATLVAHPQRLAQYELSLTTSQLRALAETLTGAGYHRRAERHSTGEAIILWNNTGSDAAQYRLAALDQHGGPHTLQGPFPRFAVLSLGESLSLHVGQQPQTGRPTVAGWFGALEERLRATPQGDLTAVVQFEITGEDGRTAYLSLQNGRVGLQDGQHAQPDLTVRAAANDWLALISGHTAPEDLFLAGKLSVAGNFDLVPLLLPHLQMAPLTRLAPHPWRLRFNFLDTLTITLSH